MFASSSKNVQDTSFIDQGDDESPQKSNQDETSPSKAASNSRLRSTDTVNPSATFHISPSGSLSARTSRSATQQMRVARFLSADLPLTDIPERESESEKMDGKNRLVSLNVLHFYKADRLDLTAKKESDLDGGNLEHQTSVARSASGDETSNFSTLKSDTSRRTMAASYCTAAESPPAADDDVSSETQKRRLIQSLRETLENLKSDSANNFDAEFKVNIIYIYTSYN